MKDILVKRIDREFLLIGAKCVVILHLIKTLKTSSLYII